VTRFFGASFWRFPSRLHARSETTGAATQRSMPSVLHLRTGVRIPPPPDFARLRRATSWQASKQLGEVCHAGARRAKADAHRPGKRASFLACESCHAEAATPKRRSREGGTSTLSRLYCGVDTWLHRNPVMFVYVLESLTTPDRHYTGLSTDPQSRLDWHNGGLSAHTSKFRPWKLLVSIDFSNMSTAVQFEST